MKKDWTGNKKSIFTTLGASSHSDHEREQNDYYATEPRVVDELFKVEEFNYPIWECACGEGHLSKRMIELGKEVYSSDLIDRGYGDVLNFLEIIGGDEGKMTHDIITNPPYKYAQEFCEQAIKYSKNKVAMFLKLTFLEGQKRKKFFEKYPPKTVYVYSSRRKCALNGKFGETGSSAAAYAWFVWVKGFIGKPTIEWI